jgi:hypothetical protein
MDQPTRSLISWLSSVWGIIFMVALVIAAIPKIFPDLSPIDWVVGFVPLVAAAMGVWVSLKPPKDNRQMVWFWAFVIVGFAATAFSLKQANDNKRDAKKDSKELLSKLQTLGTVSALRKQGFDLASELKEYTDKVGIPAKAASIPI